MWLTADGRAGAAQNGHTYISFPRQAATRLVSNVDGCSEVAAGELNMDIKPKRGRGRPRAQKKERHRMSEQVQFLPLDRCEVTLSCASRTRQSLRRRQRPAESSKTPEGDKDRLHSNGTPRCPEREGDKGPTRMLRCYVGTIRRPRFRPPRLGTDRASRRPLRCCGSVLCRGGKVCVLVRVLRRAQRRRIRSDGGSCAAASSIPLWRLISSFLTSNISGQALSTDACAAGKNATMLLSKLGRRKEKEGFLPQFASASSLSLAPRAHCTRPPVHPAAPWPLRPPPPALPRPACARCRRAAPRRCRAP